MGYKSQYSCRVAVKQLISKSELRTFKNTSHTLHKVNNNHNSGNYLLYLKNTVHVYCNCTPELLICFHCISFRSAQIHRQKMNRVTRVNLHQKKTKIKIMISTSKGNRIKFRRTTFSIYLSYCYSIGVYHVQHQFL